MHDESNGNILVPKDAADEEEDYDFSVDKIASSGHTDKQHPAPFESTAGDKSFGEVVKKEDLRLALDEEVTGDVKFGTFNKKYSAGASNPENSPLVDQENLKESSGGGGTEKIEKGALKKAIDLQLHHEKHNEMKDVFNDSKS